MRLIAEDEIKKDEAETRYERRSRRRNRGRRRAVVMLACLTAMVAVMFGTVSLCAWVAEKWKKDAAPALGEADSASGNLTNYVDIDKDGNVLDAAGNVIGVLSGSVGYSQAELDEQVTAARQAASAEVLENIRGGLDAGDSVLETLRPLYPDDLIVYSGGKYNFVPINRNLKLHSYDKANLNILESGEYQYLQEGEVVSYKGIDVSRHQGTIDWNMVAQDGVEFAFIRVGYRGYGSGKMMEDEFFEENIKGALQAGIKVGVYFYSQAVSREEVLEEAQFVLDKIAPYKIECPVVFDVERVSEGEGRMNAISMEDRTAFTALFCQTIENAGYRPMIYHNTEMGVMMLGLSDLEAYDKWFAAYSDLFYYPYDYKVWQYSQSGRVQGIQGDVDLNISFVPLWETGETP